MYKLKQSWRAEYVNRNNLKEVKQVWEQGFGICTGEIPTVVDLLVILYISNPLGHILWMHLTYKKSNIYYDQNTCTDKEKNKKGKRIVYLMPVITYKFPFWQEWSFLQWV